MVLNSFAILSSLPFVDWGIRYTSLLVGLRCFTVTDGRMLLHFYIFFEKGMLTGFTI